MDRQPGQPTKLTPETTEKLVYAISKGASYEIACYYAGISYRAFRFWMVKGEAGENEKYVHFFHTIKKAVGSTALKWLSVIDNAMERGDWQSAAWKLERRHWKDFSRHVEVLGVNEMSQQLQDKIDQGVAKNVKVNNKAKKETS